MSTLDIAATETPALDHFLARRLRGAKPSKVRQVFRAAQRPGMISFANGAPNLTDLPFARLARDAERLLRERGHEALQYGASDGISELRSRICEVMALEGIRAEADEVIVTAGSQQALDIAARATVDPGDVIFAEGPSYAGGMAVFASYEADIVHVPSDHEGIIPAELERLIREVKAAGRRPRGLYTIPTFQNPGGTVLSVNRRQRLGDICREAGMLIYEDNPYGMLGFEGQSYPAIRTSHPDITLYFGSFSKMFSPGLRVGWMTAPVQLHATLVNTAETAALNPSVFNQLLINEYLSDPTWIDTLNHYRGLYRAKLDALVETLAEVMPPGCRWNQPEGGFYLWISVPEQIDTEALVFEAIERGVVYVPGTAFYTDGRGRHELRMSFCLPSIEEIRTGAAVLGDLFAAALGSAGEKDQ